MIDRLVSTLLVYTAAMTATAQDPSPVELPCDTQMVFGHAYGGTEIHSPIEMMTLNSVRVEPKPEFAPFDYVEIGVSAKGRLVWSASGSAAFANAETARAFMAALVARFEAAIKVSEKIGDDDVVMLFNGRRPECNEAARGECYLDGVKIELAYRARAVYERAIEPDRVELECVDIGMENVAFVEALGPE